MALSKSLSFLKRHSQAKMAPDDQGHQEDAKIGDGNGESIRCGCHPIAPEEGAAFGGPCL